MPASITAAAVAIWSATRLPPPYMALAQANSSIPSAHPTKIGCSESLTINVQIPSTSVGLRPASAIASRQAATAMPRVVRPELREYSVRPIPTTAQVIWLSDLLGRRIARQAEDALGDKVSDDLRSAARDREAPAEQIIVHNVGFLTEQDGPVGDTQSQLGHPLGVFGPEQLGDVALDPGPGVEDSPRRLPQVQGRQRVGLDQQRTDVAREPGVVGPVPGQQIDQSVGGHGDRATADRHPL